MNSFRKTLLALLIILGFEKSLSAQSITQILVWNADFKSATPISETDSIKKLNALWHAKKPIRLKATPTWKYKLDIYSPKAASRWLYDPAGFTMLLSKSKSPIYSISSPEQFNKLIEINP